MFCTGDSQNKNMPSFVCVAALIIIIISIINNNNYNVHLNESKYNLEATEMCMCVYSMKFNISSSFTQGKMLIGELTDDSGTVG